MSEVLFRISHLAPASKDLEAYRKSYFLQAFGQPEFYSNVGLQAASSNSLETQAIRDAQRVEINNLQKNLR